VLEGSGDPPTINAFTRILPAIRPVLGITCLGGTNASYWVQLILLARVQVHPASYI